jgi:hypothetical protein
MTEEINQSIVENPSEKEDNRLPYEKPKLRKHGKVNDATETTPVFGTRIDTPFGRFRALS